MYWGEFELTNIAHENLDYEIIIVSCTPPKKTPYTLPNTSFRSTIRSSLNPHASPCLGDGLACSCSIHAGLISRQWLWRTEKMEGRR